MGQEAMQSTTASESRDRLEEGMSQEGDMGKQRSSSQPENLEWKDRLVEDSSDPSHWSVM